MNSQEQEKILKGLSDFLESQNAPHKPLDHLKSWLATIVMLSAFFITAAGGYATVKNQSLQLDRLEASFADISDKFDAHLARTDIHLSHTLRLDALEARVDRIENRSPP